MERPDVLVVGGGAIGAASALELARAGARVMLVERGCELAAGCSEGSAGLICPSHALPIATPTALRNGLRWLASRDSPFSIRLRPDVVPWLLRFVASCTPEHADASMRLIRSLSLAGLELHAGLAAAGLDTTFTRRGVLNVYETASGLAEGCREAELHASAGISSETLDPAAARAREPALMGRIAGAILYPDEAHCDPKRFVLAVGKAAAQAGASIRLHLEVLSLRREKRRVTTVETTAGPIEPGAVVLAAGAWTPRLAADLDVFVPVQGGKGYHVDVERTDDDPASPVFLREAHVVATPLPDRLRLAGTLELSGLDMSVDRARVDAIVGSAREVLRLGRRPVLGIWRGLRPCAPDGLPILGRPDGLDNVVLATGHAMMGHTLAPVTGRLVAQLVGHETASFDLTALSPNRFRRLRLRSSW
jgi:D-amino-acid dehydrogenase